VKERPRKVLDVVAVQVEDLQRPLVDKDVIGHVLQGAVAIVQLRHLLLHALHAGQAGQERHDGGGGDDDDVTLEHITTASFPRRAVNVARNHRVVRSNGFTSAASGSLLRLF
jgi:hypothetical protein